MMYDLYDAETTDRILHPSSLLWTAEMIAERFHLDLDAVASGVDAQGWDAALNDAGRYEVWTFEGQMLDWTEIDATMLNQPSERKPR